MWERDALRLNRKPPGGSQRFQLPTFSAVTDAIGSHPKWCGGPTWISMVRVAA